MDPMGWRCWGIYGKIACKSMDFFGEDHGFSTHGFIMAQLGTYFFWDFWVGCLEIALQTRRFSWEDDTMRISKRDFWKTNLELYWLVVWTPLKNISQLGWLFPIYGKIKNVPNHQPGIIWDFSVISMDCFFGGKSRARYVKESPTILGSLRLLVPLTGAKWSQ